MTQGRDPPPSLPRARCPKQTAPPHSPGRAASHRQQPPSTTSLPPGRKALYEALPEPSTVEGKHAYLKDPQFVSPLVNKALGGKDHGRDKLLGPCLLHKPGCHVPCSLPLAMSQEEMVGLSGFGRPVLSSGHPAIRKHRQWLLLREVICPSATLKPN